MSDRAVSVRQDDGETIVRLSQSGRAVLRCPETMTDIISQRLGIRLPLQACRSAMRDDLSALWLGPDEWLLLSAASTETWIAETQAKLGGSRCALIDVSHRQVALSLHGNRAEEVLASGCPLDVSPLAFPVGMCTRTMFNKAEIILWRVGIHRFQLECLRSFGPYVEGLLRLADGEA